MCPTSAPSSRCSAVVDTLPGCVCSCPSDVSIAERLISARGEKINENYQAMRGWCYFSRKELAENSPSRGGISLKMETYLRKSYCTFLKKLGIRLQVSQITIAAATILCHRFILIQSHLKNDKMTIATVCMFLAGKSQETPRSLRDVVIISYELIHNKDKTAAQRIKQREFYQQQKEKILVGERLVLVTLGFDLKVDTPYIPLLKLIKKFGVKEVVFAQVAWSFVNDGLWALLCLQFDPHQIAVVAFYLAVEHLKVNIPSNGEKLWWEAHGVRKHQLDEIRIQIFELYNQLKEDPVVAAERSEITESGCSLSPKSSLIHGSGAKPWRVQENTKAVGVDRGR